MAARYPYYLLADSSEGVKKEAELTGQKPPPHETEGDIRKGFVYKRVPHVTLKSIANNPDIKEGMTREQIDQAIALRRRDGDAVRQALRRQAHRPCLRPVHGREPVAAPRARDRPRSAPRTETEGARGNRPSTSRQ